MTQLLVGQGDGCVVILQPPGVMAPEEAERLGLALICAAERARGGCDLCRSGEHYACDQAGRLEGGRCGCTSGHHSTVPGAGGLLRRLRKRLGGRRSEPRSSGWIGEPDPPGQLFGGVA